MRIAAILALLISSAPTARAAFTDTQTHWGRHCIDRLRENNLVSGYPDGSFRPEATVTRAEFAILMLNTFPNAPRVRTAPRFTDVPSNYWAARAIRDAAERAFFAGYPDGTFKPTQAIPRVQALAVLSGAKQFPVPENYDILLDRYFDDALQIPRYAERSLAAAIQGGIVVNYPNVRKLQPNRNATRGEIAAMLCQARKLGDRIVPPQYIASEVNLWRDLFVFPPEIETVGRFSEGLAPAKLDGNKIGYIDDRGNTIIPARFEVANAFSEGLAWASPVNGAPLKFGYLDRSGNWVITPQFAIAQDFSENLAVVSWDGQKYGVIDRTGKTIVPPQFDFMLSFSDGIAAVLVGDRWGFIDLQGNPIVSPQYINVQSFSEGLAFVSSEEESGFIDRTGTMAIEIAAARSFSEGLAAARDETTSKWGFIDKTGNWAIEPIYDAVQEFSEGLAGVTIQEKSGFIDATGKNVIPLQFFSFGESNSQSYPQAVQPFSEGIALVRNGTGIGYIDRQGRWLVEPIIYNDGESVVNGLARVHIGGEWVPEYVYANNDAYLQGVTLQGGGWGYIRVFKPMEN